MLSLCELRRSAEAIASGLAGFRAERFVQPDGERVAIALSGRDPEHGDRRSRVLQLCAANEVARISEPDALPKAPQNPPAFVSYLRAHLGRARLTSARLLDEDRQLALHFEAREAEFELVLSILGPRSNVYVLDAEQRVVALLRPAAETRPELTLGERYTTPEGAPPRQGEDRWPDVGTADYLAAIEAEYSAREASREVELLARELRQLLRRERKSAARRLEKIEQELVDAERAGELQRHGELLKGALAGIRPGDSEVRARDYTSGEEVVIPLDPTLSAKQNLEATFKRYQKMLRRLAKAGGQVDQARARCETLASLEQELEALAADGAAIDVAALHGLAARPELARLQSRARASRAAAGPAAAVGKEPGLPPLLRGLPRRLQPRRYLSRDGLEIWVGRSDEGNDHLTTRLARGKDLFFHLDGAPGSHVILRTAGRSDPPSESLLDASELAVHFSKQKNAGRADVHIVPIKQVKKPKGAKRGLVFVTGGRSLHLRRDEKRLERLLASLIEP